MTYTKLPDVHTYGKALISTMRKGVVSWLSGDKRHLITLYSGKNTPFKDDWNKYDYIRLCTLRSNGEVELTVEKFRCTQDGTAAFLINEIMDITTEHEGQFDVDYYIRAFSRAIVGESVKLRNDDCKGVDFYGPNWVTVTLRAFQEAKEQRV